MDENTINCGTQNGNAKSAKAKAIAQIARIVRREGFEYEDWRYVAKQVRKECQLRPKKKGRKLPNVLTADEFQRFYKVVDEADDVQHSLMLRLLFFTGVRVSELCNIEVNDVDLASNKIRINQGKGAKDRFVLFNRQFVTTLRTHLAAHPNNRWLFQTRRNSKFTTRRVQQIVQRYAQEAGVKASPHTFRHQFCTWMAKHSGMGDAQLQLLTGHSKRETLSIYQHLIVDQDLESKYQNAMSGVGL